MSGFPTEPSQETMASINKASSNDPMGQHQGGKDMGTEVQDPAKGKVKSEKEREYVNPSLSVHAIDWWFPL